MSKPQTDKNTIRIQFTVKKGDSDFQIIKDILEKYPSNVMAKSIKEALKDLLNIFETTETKNSSELIKNFFKESD
jgi:hypothetical protein